MPGRVNWRIQLSRRVQMGVVANRNITDCIVTTWGNQLISSFRGHEFIYLS